MLSMQRDFAHGLGFEWQYLVIVVFMLFGTYVYTSSVC